MVLGHITVKSTTKPTIVAGDAANYDKLTGDCSKAAPPFDHNAIPG